MTKNPKHWLKREENTVIDGKTITVYIVECGKPGLPRRETTKDLTGVTCPNCAARIPRSKLLKR